MPELYVHLADPTEIAAHIKDPDPEKGRASALAEAGLWHRVASFENAPGAHDRDESRIYTTTCGLTQADRPDRMDEAENPPKGALCAVCFGKKGK